MENKIAERLEAYVKGIAGFYRNDSGYGCAGPAYITVSEDDYEDILSELEDGQIVEHDYVFDHDSDGNPITAMGSIQQAIDAHNDRSIASAIDIYVVVENKNGWSGVYWLYEL